MEREKETDSYYPTINGSKEIGNERKDKKKIKIKERVLNQQKERNNNKSNRRMKTR